MTERKLQTLIGMGNTVAAAAISMHWQPALSRGIIAGGAWGLVNLWCLAQVLSRWLTPECSRWRIMAWVLVKFPLLYGVAIWCLTRPRISPLGFGLGFFTALTSAIVVSLLVAQRAMRSLPTHGR